MGYLYEGDVVLKGNFIVRSKKPLDNRSVVQNRSDLYTINPETAYLGMAVISVDDSTIHILRDLDNIHNSSGWRSVSMGDEVELRISNSSDGFLAFGEVCTLTLSVWQNNENITELVTSWLVTRNSGDVTADNAWNVENATKIVSHGTYADLEISSTLEKDDLGAGSLTMFNITANIGEASLTQELSV